MTPREHIARARELIELAADPERAIYAHEGWADAALHGWYAGSLIMQEYGRAVYEINPDARQNRLSGWDTVEEIMRSGDIVGDDTFHFKNIRAYLTAVELRNNFPFCSLSNEAVAQMVDEVLRMIERIEEELA